MDKKQYRILLIALAVIIIVLAVVTLQPYLKKDTTGNAVNEQKSSGPIIIEPKYNTDIEGKKQAMNEAVNFLRSCLSNCPKECASCGVLSLKCEESCDYSATSKIYEKGYEISSEEEAISLMNSDNQIWTACFKSCYNEGSEEYVDYDCVHGC